MKSANIYTNENKGEKRAKTQLWSFMILIFEEQKLRFGLHDRQMMMVTVLALDPGEKLLQLHSIRFLAVLFRRPLVKETKATKKG